MRVRADLSVTDVQLDGNEIAVRVRNQIAVDHRAGATERTDARWMTLLVRDSTGWHLSSAP